jgi:phage FluMu gp28-like protein
MATPAVRLYDFQARWLADKSRFKIGNICRQAGKSFMVSLEAVDDSIETNKDWVLLSAGERQSKELMSKVKMHTEAYQIAASSIQQDFFEDTRYTMLTIHLPNGARIMGLPANPDTARGFSANVILDEFAFHKDSDKIWKALYPTISRGYKLRIVSTPQGMGNRFHTLFTGDNTFSKHFVDIYKAVSDGVPHNINELKAGIDDEDAWNQEYLCLFIDEASAWLTYELIAACADDSVADEIFYDNFTLRDFNPQFTGPVYCGVDIGRKRDLTVFNLGEQLGDVFWDRLTLILPKVKFRDQQKCLSDLIRKFNITRTCIDSTGIGAQLGEDTEDEFPGRVEAVDFTGDVKNDLATRTLRIFQDRRCRIASSRVLRDDLHSIKKTTTAAGHIRFDAERTKDGHADRFWAKSLMYMASDEGIVKPECILI